MKRLIIVDDDYLFCNITSKFLVENNWEVTVSNSSEEFYKKLDADKYIGALIDLQLGFESGLDVLVEVKKRYPSLPVIMCTAYGSVESAVEAMRLGALDYIGKPIIYDELLMKLNRIHDDFRKDRELKELQDRYHFRTTFRDFIGRSKAVDQVFDRCRSIMDALTTILIQGETGTGKEIIAKAIHYESVRKDKPFVIVNCAVLQDQLLASELFGHEKGSFTGAYARKEGKFEVAEDGTLFLDEVGELSLSLQKKFLRVLQENEFEPIGSTKTIKSHCRIIAATNRDLKAMVDEGTFREDLFFRLSIVPIYIPPLRERAEDIPELANYFIDKFCIKSKKDKLKVTNSFISRLMRYPFPGNVRELEHLIERLVLMSKGPEIHFDNDFIDNKVMEVLGEDECNVNIAEYTKKYENRYYTTILEKFEWDTAKA
ncbi:hypothetical protein BVX93_02240, partial [bacterium B13(2017)]